MLWDAESGQRLAEAPASSDETTAIEWSPDGASIVIGTRSGGLEVWDDATLTRRFWLPPSPTRQRAGPAYSVAYSPRGDRFATGMSQGRILVWDGLAGVVRQAFALPDAGPIGSLAWSPDGRLLVAGDMWRKGLAVCDPDSGQTVRTLDGLSREVAALAWSKDGKCLAAAAVDNQIGIWDLDGKLVGTIEMASDVVTGLAWSPDGSRLASLEIHGRVRVWDPVRRERLREMHLTAERPTRGLAWSPDGRELAAGCGKSIVVYDPNLGERIDRWEAHAAPVSDLVWLPEGNTLVSAGLDGTLRVWDGTQGKAVHTLTGPAPPFPAHWADPVPRTAL